MSNHVSAGLIESCNSQPSRLELASLHGHLSGVHRLAESASYLVRRSFITGVPANP